MTKKEIAIEKMKAFVTGQITIENFWEEVSTNKAIQEILVAEGKESRGSPLHMASIESLLKFKGDFIKTLNGAAAVSFLVAHYFVSRGESVQIDPIHNRRYRFFMEIQPEWIVVDGDLDGENFIIENVLKKVPSHVKTHKQAVKWGKEEVLRHFRYDKVPPRWIYLKPPQWPIVNGKPLVFKRQSELASGATVVHFYFYCPDTGKETVVTQTIN